MKHILIYSSNSFSFAFYELKYKDFGVVCVCFLNSIMFSICAFLRQSLRGLCSFSLNGAGRLSETQTLPSYPRQEPHRQVESPLCPVEDATIIYSHHAALNGPLSPQRGTGKSSNQ